MKKIVLVALIVLCGSGFCAQLLADCKEKCNSDYSICFEGKKSCDEQRKKDIQACLDRCKNQ